MESIHQSAQAFSASFIHSLLSNQHQSTLTSFHIRRCTLEDELNVVAAILRTGDAGNDATSHFNDPHLLGHRYASPYIHLAPDLVLRVR